MSKFSPYTRLLIVAVALGTSAAGAQTTVTFTDDTFDDSDWTAEMIVNEAGNSAEFTAEQDAPGGNPGAFRRIQHVGRAGSSPREIHVAHLRVGAIYDPQVDGRITGVSYSYDLKNLETRTIWDSRFYFLIFQNDTYYRSALDRIATLDWVPFGRTALDARDFTRISETGPRRPDFSGNGPPLHFGFDSVSRFPSGSHDDSRNSGIDNWSVTIVPEGAPSCEIVPRNTYLPTHMFEFHLSNPPRHPPHLAAVVVTFGGVPPSGSVEISLTATKAAFLDDSETQILSALTLNTDNDGRAGFKHPPPSAEPFDRTDFEAGGSIDGVPFSCRGSVVSGMGALTALLQGAHLPRAMAPLRRLWNDVLAHGAAGRDAADLSPEETVRILLDDPELRRRLLEVVRKYPPLLQGIAITKAVSSRQASLDKIDSVLIIGTSKGTWIPSCGKPSARYESI